MKHAARSLLAAAGPVLAVTVAWGSLESPVAWHALLLIAVLAIVPAALARPAHRLAAAVVVTVAAASIAFDVSPLAALPWTAGTWLGEIRRAFEVGLRAFEVVALPFDPAVRPTMHALTQTAVFGFSLAAALAVAWRRPLAAGLAVVLGAGWATASMPDDRLVLMGGLLLLGTLWPLVVLRVRSRRDVVAALTAVSAVAVVGVGTAAVGAAPDAAALEWRSWSVVGDTGARLGVRYVWDAQYDGIEFPARPTAVLRVQGPRTAHYWRASTLELFTGDRWLESLYPYGTYTPPLRLPRDPLLPAAARREVDFVEQTVEVAALEDDHLVAAGQAMRLESDAVGGVLVSNGGVMQVGLTPPAGSRYTVWSYVPHPAPRQLLASRPDYPPEVVRYLAIDRTSAPPFGAPGRTATVDRLWGNALYRAIWSYRPLWQEAKRVAAGQETPYEATLAVEQWLRTTGGFRYEERRPPGIAVGPPLVDFVVRHRAGYCQHFAGTMALMLRMLGIPSRVAVGFTSGTWTRGEWVVNDTDAHAWVEAWFDGHGWLPFDPTPGRGSFSASYTFASDSADAVFALGRGDLLAVLPDDQTGGTPGSTSSTSGQAEVTGDRPVWPAVVGGLLLLPPLLLLCVKAARRRIRYRSTDPRRVAAATRADLVDLLRDQGVDVPPNVGARRLQTAIERHLGVSGGPFVGAHQRARFGPPDVAGMAATDARRELRALKTLAWERLGPGRRLRGALSLRSLRQA